MTGGALLLLKKPGLAGTGFVLSAATPLIVLMTSSSIQTAVTSLGVSNIIISYQWPFLLTLILGLAAGVLAIWTKGGEKLAESIFRIFACVSVGSVVIITVYMIVSGAPAIAEIGLGNFSLWHRMGAEKRRLRNFALDTLLHRRYCGSSDYRCSHRNFNRGFLSETAPKWVASVVRPAVQLLAGIPSVVYGFFGMLIIVPAIRSMFPGQTIGDSLLAVILILAIMVLPTIVSVSETSLRAVPVSYREASLALGTTPVKTIFKVTVPAAKSGILAGVF